jgi:hypothetical protein
MKYCQICKVQADTSKEFCPLCHNAMEEIDEKHTPEIFPEYKKSSPRKKSLKALAVKICLILSVMIIATCMFINVQTETLPWSVTVALVIVYLWVLIAHTIMSHGSAFDKVFFELSAICAFLISVDLVFSSTRWFTHFVYPALSIASTLFLTIMLISRHDKKNWVFSFFCIFFLVAVVSAIFLIFKIDTFKILNIINIIFQLIVMFGYLLFHGRHILAQAARKFHI